MTDYATLTRAKLIEHCMAYGAGLHDMKNGFQDLLVKLYVARKRLSDFGITDTSAERITAVPILCEGLGVEW